MTATPTTGRAAGECRHCSSRLPESRQGRSGQERRFHVITRVMVLFLFLAFVAGPVATAAPTMAQVRESFAAGQYQPTLRSIADCLALKGQAAEGYDRYELLTLKGECLIQLKSAAYAANAFEDAQAA